MAWDARTVLVELEEGPSGFGKYSYPVAKGVWEEGTINYVSERCKDDEVQEVVKKEDVVVLDL
jgi:predicted nuclease with RNAse H fold